MRKTAMLSLLCVALCCVAAETAAQSAQNWSLQGSFLSESLYGDEFEGIEDGGGFEIQGRYTPGAVSFGAGLQYTTHDFTDPELEGAAVNIVGLFFEPRFVILTGSNNFAPYLAARLAMSRFSVTADGDEIADAIGPTANGGGGVLVRLGSRLNLDVGATYGFTNWGDLEVGDTSVGELGAGTNLIIRIGLAYGFGG